MKKLLSIGALALAALVGLTSCGGSGNTITNPGGGGGAAQVASITVLAASPQLPSDQTGLTNVQITAQVKDAGNAVISDVPVAFGATSGSIAATQPITDGVGQAIALLSNGTNPTNRSVTITATAGGVTGSVVVAITGSTVNVSGPTSLASAQSGAYTASVRDSKGVGVPGVTVEVTSATGNSIAAPSLVTDPTGNVSLTVTATVPGNDTLTVRALGQTGAIPITVSGDDFTFVGPAAGAEVVLGASQSLSVRWTKNGVPQANELIDFSTTRGTISGGDVSAFRDTTDANGVATVSISSLSAGPAVVTATINKPGSSDNGTTASRPIEFVATNPTTVVLQASPLTVATRGQSELIAIVRDPNDNLVKNRLVQFVIEQDASGGSSLSVGSSITDSQGRARSVYTAGSDQTAANGVLIRAIVPGTPAPVESTVNLTVARQQLFLTLGTGNTLFEIGTATYGKEWVILVTDVEGNAVPGASVQAAIRSRRFFRGELVWNGSSSWVDSATSPSPPEGCFDEDVNRNGLLDPGEDLNSSTFIEAGNVASVAPVPESAPLNSPCASAGTAGTTADVVTNNQGRARVCVFYPQNFARWVEAALTAKSSVSGTEFTRSSVFLLDVSSDDIDDQAVQPPNIESPYGPSLVPDGVGGFRQATCADPPPAP